MSEQLEGDLKRNELVSEGKLSKREAEEQAEEWEKVGCIAVVFCWKSNGSAAATVQRETQ